MEPIQQPHDASDLKATLADTQSFVDQDNASTQSSADNNDAVTTEDPDKTLDGISDQLDSLSLQPSKPVNIDHDIISSLHDFIRAKNELIYYKDAKINELQEQLHQFKDSTNLKDSKIRELEKQLGDEKRQTLVAEQKTADALRQLKGSAILVSEKESKISELHSQLNDENSRTLLAEQKTADALRQLKDSTILVSEKESKISELHSQLNDENSRTLLAEQKTADALRQLKDSTILVSEKESKISELHSQLNDENRRTLLAEQKTADAIRQLKDSTILVSEKESKIRELEKQLGDEKRQTLVAEQKTADALRQLKDSAILAFDKEYQELHLQLKDEKRRTLLAEQKTTDVLRKLDNQIRLFKEQLRDIVLKPYYTYHKNANIAIANLLLIVSDTFEIPEVQRLLQKVRGKFNGLVTLQKLLENSVAVNNISITTSFAWSFFVNERKSWLSVGAGTGSFEAALISMIPRENRPTKIVISPCPAAPHVKGIQAYQFSYIDATNIGELSMYGLPPDAAILFNCPWETGSTHQLVMQFMLSASCVQSKGGWVFLGITECEEPKYFRQYGINTLVAVISQVYSLKYLDIGIIKHALSGGYRHLCSKPNTDIHDIVVKQHVMLCFERL